MWEKTFPRSTYAGLGKPMNEDKIRLSMNDASLSPCPIRRGKLSVSPGNIVPHIALVPSRSDSLDSLDSRLV